MSRVHRLKDLRGAEFVTEGPFTTEPKLRGKAKEGIAYQKQVHCALAPLTGDLVADQWIRFRDGRTYHWCRPDSILDTWDRVIVWESKLSLRQLDKGLAQLRLYRPILELIFDKPVAGVIVFKHWSLGTANCLPMIDDPAEALSFLPSRMKKPHGWNYVRG